MKKQFRLNLLAKMILLMSLVVTACLVLSAFAFFFILNDAMEKHFGARALDVALMVAKNERIIEGFQADYPPQVIQPIAENIRELTGASYVVVGNLHNVRYSHHDLEQIGQKMGTSNDEVFEQQQPIIYNGVGVSGLATKAKTPIYNEEEELIGVASVGFLYEEIKNELRHYQMILLLLILIVFFIGISGAYIVARKLKRMFFGLEPEEISYLFKEKEAILDSMHDATVAINSQGQIVSMNKKARHIPYFSKLKIRSFLDHPQLTKDMLTVPTEQNVSNRKIVLDHELFVMDYSTILDNHHLRGIVFTFRPVSEIEQLTKEFSEIKIFTENMRAQNHEFLNKLNTLYGLLKLKKVDEAIQLISSEVNSRQDFIAFLLESVKNPLVAACLLGKVNRAYERKVTLSIDQNSNLQPFPPTIDEPSVVTILANILENAIEAAFQAKQEEGKVSVSFTDFGSDIIFDIEDNGHGIKPNEEKVIFEPGFTTKASSSHQHGIGLFLVKNKLEALSGNVFISKSELGGARFTISIPKAQRQGGCPS